jgi:hypothetical protein
MGAPGFGAYMLRTVIAAFSDMIIAISAYLWYLFAWKIFFHPLT